MDMQNILLNVGAVFLAVTYQLRRLENESVGESPFIKPSGNGASIIARWTSSGDDKRNGLHSRMGSPARLPWEEQGFRHRTNSSDWSNGYSMMCFDGSPVEGDSRSFRADTFQITMMESLWKNQPTCLCTCLFPPCSAAYLRYTALDRDMSRYSCCQGYMDNVCFKSGKCGEKSCPEFCLCMEVFMCLGPSISSTRMMVMDQYEIRPDPCDNRIIRFTNCLMLLSCFCDLLSICVKELRHFANIIHSIANCVAYSTIGCMASQVFREVAYRREYRDEYAGWADGDKLNSPIMGHVISYQDTYKDPYASNQYPL